MFCPRCGTQNPETTKFCRQCGLPLAQVAGVVAGGTGALASPAPPAPQPMLMPGQLPETAEMLAAKQKRTMTIMGMCLLPAVSAIVGDMMFNAGEVVAALFLLIPLGVFWAQSRYKIELRRLQEEQLRQFYAGQSAYSQPAHAFQPPVQTPQLPPPPTNPFNLANPVQGSVIEDDTRKLPIRNQ